MISELIKLNILSCAALFKQWWLGYCHTSTQFVSGDFGECGQVISIVAEFKVSI